MIVKCANGIKMNERNNTKILFNLNCQLKTIFVLGKHAYEFYNLVDERVGVGQFGYCFPLFPLDSLVQWKCDCTRRVNTSKRDQQEHVFT